MKVVSKANFNLHESMLRLWRRLDKQLNIERLGIVFGLSLTLEKVTQLLYMYKTKP